MDSRDQLPTMSPGRVQLAISWTDSPVRSVQKASGIFGGEGDRREGNSFGGTHTTGSFLAENALNAKSESQTDLEELRQN